MTDKDIYINILKSAVNNYPIQITEEIDLDKLWSFAEAHSVRATIAKTLLDKQILDETWRAEWKEALNKNVRKTILFEKEWGIIKNSLENEKIWYAPIKGEIINRLYPKYGMREFSDKDILINSDLIDKTVPVMISLGYRFDKKHTQIHYSFHKEPFFAFEFHHSLFRKKDNNEDIYNYFQSFYSRLITSSDNEYSRCFSDEDNYLYFIAHAYNHYKSAGTGMRTLADIYLCLSKLKLNRDYIQHEFDKMGLSEYASQMESVALKLFSGSEPFSFDILTESENKLLNEIIDMGTYGNSTVLYENHFNEYLKRSGKNSKAGYYLSRVFPSMENYHERYPFIYSHKVLYPFFYTFRPFRALVKNRRKIFTEIQTVKRFKPKE